MNRPPDHDSVFSRRVRDFVLTGFQPTFRRRQPHGPATSLWERLNALRTDLWLDSGDVESLRRVWTQEFSAVTTNNTLLNREVQKGTYDGFIAEASRLLDEYPDLDDQTRRFELAFMLNAKHALSLVEAFDAYVSVEEHTDLAADVDASVHYGLRLHAICPERFYVKVPFSAGGLMAARRLTQARVPVNLTLGFSARQAYVATRLARPQWVNVFLGRLNAFAWENGFGTGDYVGERATLAAQEAVHRLRADEGVSTRLIAASLRTAAQVRDLAGVDVMTIPPDVAEAFMQMGLREQDLFDRSAEPYEPVLEGDPVAANFESLWTVEDRVVQCVDRLLDENVDTFSATDLADYFGWNACGDLLVHWNDDQLAGIAEDGKIPRFEHWSKALEAREIGLDSLMNLAGLASFGADQEAMDRRVENVLKAPASA